MPDLASMYSFSSRLSRRGRLRKTGGSGLRLVGRFRTQASRWRRLYGEHATDLVARETGGHLSNWNNLDNGGVVRHPAWVQAAGRDQDIELWPITLQAPRIYAVD